jgi:uncharacterized membrane protein
MFRALLFAILATLSLTLPAAAVARDCISDEVARQMIEEKALLPLPEAIRRFGNVQANQIIGVTLCRFDDGLFYEVEILEAGRKRLERIPGAST